MLLLLACLLGGCQSMNNLSLSTVPTVPHILRHKFADSCIECIVAPIVHMQQMENKG